MAVAVVQAAKAVQAATAAKVATTEATAVAVAVVKAAAGRVREEVAASEGHSTALEVRTLVKAAVVTRPPEVPSVAGTMEMGNAWRSGKGLLVRPSQIGAPSRPLPASGYPWHCQGRSVAPPHSA